MFTSILSNDRSRLTACLLMVLGSLGISQVAPVYGASGQVHQGTSDANALLLSTRQGVCPCQRFLKQAHTVNGGQRVQLVRLAPGKKRSQ